MKGPAKDADMKEPEAAKPQEPKKEEKKPEEKKEEKKPIEKDNKKDKKEEKSGDKAKPAPAPPAPSPSPAPVGGRVEREQMFRFQIVRIQHASIFSLKPSVFSFINF